MNRAFHFAIGLAVAVHMVLGCCSHHAHGAHLADSPTVESAFGCGHHEGSEPRDPQSGNQGCAGNQCVSTRPESGSDSKVTVGPDCLPLICVAPIRLKMNGTDAPDTMLDHLCPPIPLHLLNQALLL